MYLPASSNLLRLTKFLDKYRTTEQPAAFEFLVATAFHRVFHLPFQTGDTEDSTVEHRVIWYGRIDERSRRFYPSPSGPDSICFAYGFHVLIENTLRGNVSNQWRKEFVESISHYDDFVRAKNLNREDVYLALVAPEFHKSTYIGFKQKAIEGYKVLMLESLTLAKVSKICESIPTLRHLDLCRLFKGIVKTFRDSGSLVSFRKGLNKWIGEWEVDMFKQEMTVYFGLKSYETIKRIGRDIVGVSEIMLGLEEDKSIERYVRKLGGGELSYYIREGLTRERLAYLVETPREDLFCRVEGADFKARGLRLIGAVERIGH